MNFQELQSKWWYRLLKIIFALAFVVGVIFAFVAISQYLPSKSTPAAKSILNFQQFSQLHDDGLSVQQIVDFNHVLYPSSSSTPSQSSVKTPSWLTYFEILIGAILVEIIFFWLIRGAFLYIFVGKKTLATNGALFGAKKATKVVLVLVGVALLVFVIVRIYSTVKNYGVVSNPVMPPSLQMPVTVLPTNDAINGSGTYSDKYPLTFSVTGNSQLTSELAAYGVIYKVWLGLTGWTGSGSIGVDGSSVVSLHPVGGGADYGERVSYSEIPACAGCMEENAAPYFSSAMQTYQEYDEKSFGVPITVPQGLEVTPISSTLVTYTLPDADGLSTLGVVYYLPGSQTVNAYYTDAEFVLPVGDTDLLNFLAQNFIQQEGLK